MFKVGDFVKINQPENDYHGKIGRIVGEKSHDKRYPYSVKIVGQHGGDIYREEYFEELSIDEKITLKIRGYV